jgi:hypothetical protein
MNCEYCSRPGTHLDGVELYPHDGDPVTVDLTLCEVCEKLLLPWRDAEDSDHYDDVRGQARRAIAHEIARVYRSDVPPALDCWWCGAPARAISVECHDRGRLVYANPVLCTICQGLMQIVGGGFANQDEAERRAENLALQKLITASRERRGITAP